MNTRTLMMHARRGEFSKLTVSQLQIAALKAFPSSQFQLAIRKELEMRQSQKQTLDTTSPI